MKNTWSHAISTAHMKRLLLVVLVCLNAPTPFPQYDVYAQESLERLESAPYISQTESVDTSSEDTSSIQQEVINSIDDQHYDIDSTIHTIQADETINLLPDNIAATESGVPLSQFEQNESGNQPIELYSDWSLKSTLDASLHQDAHNHAISIRPHASLFEITMSPFTGGRHHIPFYGGGSWGILDTFYLVQYNDLMTGKLLPKPKLKVFQLADDNDLLATPIVSYHLDAQGALVLSWDTITEAEKYYIVKLSYYPTFDQTQQKWRYQMSRECIGITDQASWKSMQTLDELGQANQTLQTFTNESEDTQLMKQTESSHNKAVPETYTLLAVVAGKGQDYSRLSTLIDLSHLSHHIPLQLATNTWEQTHAYVKQSGMDNMIFEQIKDLPRTLPITMANGKTTQCPVQLDLDHIKQIDMLGKQALAIPATVVGTPFQYEFKLLNYDEQYLTSLQKYQETDVSTSD